MANLLVNSFRVGGLEIAGLYSTREEALETHLEAITEYGIFEITPVVVRKSLAFNPSQYAPLKEYTAPGTYFVVWGTSNCADNLTANHVQAVVDCLFDGCVVNPLIQSHKQLEAENQLLGTQQKWLLEKYITSEPIDLIESDPYGCFDGLPEDTLKGYIGEFRVVITPPPVLEPDPYDCSDLASTVKVQIFFCGRWEYLRLYSNDITVRYLDSSPIICYKTNTLESYLDGGIGKMF